MTDDAPRQPATAYLVDPVTGCYMGTDIAPPDPMEAENFLWPADSVSIAPSAPEQGKSSVWQNGAWTQVYDYRGQPVFNTVDGSRVMVTDFGPVPDGFTLLDPSAVPHAKWNGSTWITDDSEQTAAQWAAIRGQRNRILYSSDWTQASDSPLSGVKIQAFAKYRVLLRNIPQTYRTPDAVIWPDAPA